MKKFALIKQPTRMQQTLLRLMILIGLYGICLLLFAVIQRAGGSNKYLFIPLFIMLVFTCFKVLTEWYHYWSISIPESKIPSRPYTVDIFTTFCAGEPYEMIVETLTAIQQITYPHEAYLCDEADDPYLKDICRQLGVHHVTRTLKINAKAGNINNALQHSKGELCVVLDPDHVPTPDFLDPIVAHFDDPKIGFVQIVQAYRNYNASWVARGAAQQTYQFYGPMMMTMNSYGTAQAIGANCTFRRTALESIGGHAAGLAEDMHTSMQLHAKKWKSVYVPAVVAKGYVPTSMSAYYMQQLKWSRGVFDLWTTSFIKLFRKFTWRQKLHYGIVPIYYFSGFVFLINFLLPVIALFTGYYPLKMGFLQFVLAGLPFITSVIMVRHYVQHWVMEDNERGFHIGGGILLIGTWWVFILGFVYTVIGKKVPYIPTPKDDDDRENWRINTPNIIVGVISLSAIVYGLYHDLNPYSIAMASMALINCLILLINIFASHQQQLKRLSMNAGRFSFLIRAIKELRGRFWLFRRKLYSGVRTAGVMLIMVSVCLIFYRKSFSSLIFSKEPDAPRQEIFLSGIFLPNDTAGLTSVKAVNQIQKRDSINFNIISFYVPFGDAPQCRLAPATMDSVYQQGSIPMITWEPWQALFKNHQGTDDKKVFANIVNGQYDAYLTHMALDLKKLGQPVFLRFAHEFDNPFYPWSASGDNNATEFKKAWVYVRTLFNKQHAWNVIWVWNPWKPGAAGKYFPGKDWVDWIGVTGLNFGTYNANHQSYSFKQLYLPFHKQRVFRLGLPVMVAEMGTLNADSAQKEWLPDALADIKKDFKEIKGVVFFDSSFDQNVPDNSGGTINWQVPSYTAVKSYFSTQIHTSLKLPVPVPANAAQQNMATAKLKDLRGVIYGKRQNWDKNILPVTGKTIFSDFSEIHNAGFNTVLINGPSIYDRSTFDIAEQKNLQIIYSFLMPDAGEIIKDPNILNKTAETVLETVKENRDNKNILAWNIGNNALQQLGKYYYKPELFEARQHYIKWLKKLVADIKKTDPRRPLTVNANSGADMIEIAALLQQYVPGIDAIGINATKNTPTKGELAALPMPYYWSQISPYIYFDQFKQGGAVLGKWQDQQTDDGLKLDGYKDLYGRKKVSYDFATQKLGGSAKPAHLPSVKILRPAATVVPGGWLTYHALEYEQHRWQLAKKLNKTLNFEWYLIHTRPDGETLSIKKVATGTYASINIPADAENYQLYLVGKHGNHVVSSSSPLNLPLYYDR